MFAVLNIHQRAGGPKKGLEMYKIPHRVSEMDKKRPLYYYCAVMRKTDSLYKIHQDASTLVLKTFLSVC